MAKDVITSTEWNDIIFEGKNKEYGAYEMRRSSSERHIIAFIISLLVVVFISFLPKLIETVVPKRASENLDESSIMANLKEVEDQIQEKNDIREETAPPPPPLKSTIQFTAPDIVESKEITDDNQIKTQEDLNQSKVQISTATVEGTDDHGVDIADLEKQKAIAGDTETKIYDIVEQQAEFPGGMASLRAFLSKNLQYPEVAQRNHIKGRVLVKFVVNKEGKISDAQIVRGVHPALDNEVIRIVKSMPDWVPGKQNGQAVNSYFTLPVDFVFK